MEAEVKASVLILSDNLQNDWSQNSKHTRLQVFDFTQWAYIDREQLMMVVFRFCLVWSSQSYYHPQDPNPSGVFLNVSLLFYLRYLHTYFTSNKWLLVTNF